MKILLITTALVSSTILGTGCASYGTDKTDIADSSYGKEQSGHNHQTAREVVSDSLITTKVKSALLTADDIKSLAISVETFDGTVQLAGFVESQWQIDKAIQIASAVEGVQNVKNDLVKTVR